MDTFVQHVFGKNAVYDDRIVANTDRTDLLFNHFCRVAAAKAGRTDEDDFPGLIRGLRASLRIRK